MPPPTTASTSNITTTPTADEVFDSPPPLSASISFSRSRGDSETLPLSDGAEVGGVDSRSSGSVTGLSLVVAPTGRHRSRQLRLPEYFRPAGRLRQLARAGRGNAGSGTRCRKATSRVGPRIW